MSSHEHPHVRRFLDCSTAHLPKNEMDAIESSEFIVAEANEYGAWVHVPEVTTQGEVDMPDEAAVQFPALLKVMVFAHKHGCDWIKFDGDAPEVPELPVFEW
jgi:hypothetical protein